MRIQPLTLLAAFVLASCLPAPHARAGDPIVVTTTADSGPGSLRAAIATANAGADDTIVFDLPGDGPHVITLTTADVPGTALVLASDVTVDNGGPAAEAVTVTRDDEAPSFRIFKVLPGVTARIAGLTISNGAPFIPDPDGGGILNQGTLTLWRTTVTGNTAQWGNGGGIDNVGATLTITESTVSHNTANGIGVFDYAYGGGINNSSVFADVGGTLTIERSTINGNMVQGDGGGIHSASSASHVTIVNSTISGNTALTGGGIKDDDSGTMTIESSTIVLNNAVPGFLRGEDVFTFGASIHNSIVRSIGPSFQDGGHNVRDSPILPLQDNGGPTMTHAIIPGSSAAGSGDTALLTDQRGVARPQGSTPDVGAFELEGPAGAHLVVTTTDDVDNGDFSAGDLSLSEAITLANSDPDVSTITFDLPGSGPHVIMAARLPVLRRDIDIDNSAAGAEAVTVFGSGSGGVVSVLSIARGVTATISGLTITNGRTGSDGAELGFAAGGGGINNLGRLTLTNCAVTGNRHANGGGILNGHAEVPSSIPEATLTVRNSTISDNIGRGVGGGIANYAVATVIDSTVSGNSTPTHGGGIYNEGTMTVVNSTVSGNRADREHAAGGGIRNEGGLTIESSTITGNSTLDYVDELDDIPGRGAGVFSPGTTQVHNSIIAGNAGPDVTGGFQSTGHNLIGDGDGTVAFAARGDQVIGDAGPGVGPLQDNGGATFTHALVAGSPAIDQGENLTTSDTDQRGPGFPRTLDDADVVNAAGGDGTDIGAYESARPIVAGHDLATVKIAVPAKVGLRPGTPVTKAVKVTVQNRSDHDEVLADGAVLGSGLDSGTGLIRLRVDVVDDGGHEGCQPADVVLDAARNARLFKRGPRIWKSKAKLTIKYRVTYDCATPLQAKTPDPSPADYRYTATVYHEAIHGYPDAHPVDDTCPHDALGLDPNPNGKIRDKGCGGKKPDRTFGNPVVTNAIAR